jgi:D-alanine-D-alanine ligase
MPSKHQVRLCKNPAAKCPNYLLSLCFQTPLRGYPGINQDWFSLAELPEMLKELGIPYTGCPAGILKLAHDKPKTKVILESEGINTPDFQLLKCGTLNNFGLRYRCIVKPRGEDASHSITQESVVYDFVLLKKQISRVSNSYGDTILVEEFVDGPEFNATIIGNGDCIALPPLR